MGRLGYKCAIDYDVYVHHFRHRSARANGLDMKKQLRKNNRKFVEKWLGTISAIFREYERQGVPISELMDSEDNKSFLKLRRINDNARFWANGRLNLK